jgi:hypothetical protein
MKKVMIIMFLLSCVAFNAGPASAMADLISFVNPLTSIDNTSGWNTAGDPSNGYIMNQSYSLLGGNATVAGYINGSSENVNLSHRPTRGLGVYGGSSGAWDEIDGASIVGTNASRVETIEITFDKMPYYVNSIEVRSLFNIDTSNNIEWAAVGFYLENALVGTEYIEGGHDLGTGTGASTWTGSYEVDKLVFYVPTTAELGSSRDLNYEVGLSDFAVAKLDVTPVPIPGALLLGLIGIGATGLKLRRFA